MTQRPSTAGFIGSPEELDALIDYLHDANRQLPVVVVSTRPPDAEPLIDAHRLARELNGVAEVRIVPTGNLSWRMKERMEEGTEVYGGAGRVYPPGLAWVTDLSRSPLRFVWKTEDAERATAALLNDAEEMATGERIERSAQERQLPNSPLAGHEGLEQLKRGLLEPAAEPTPVAKTGRENDPPAPPDPAERKQGRTALQSAQRSLEIERAENHRLRAQLVEAHEQARKDVAEEVRALRVENARLEATIRENRDRHERALRAARARKSAAPGTGDPPFDPALFVDPAEAVRFAVLRAWVQRIQPVEKEHFPLPDFVVGDRFADSLAALDDGQQVKALKCIVDVLTDRAKDVPGRQLHALRNGDTGPDVVRADGARAFRASIEAETPSARRLHYFKLPDGRVELSRLVLHDDMDP